MNELEIKEYIFSLSKANFMEQYKDVVHTEAFSAIASRCIDENSCEQLKTVFSKIDMPCDMYATDESIYVVVKSIAARYIELK